MVGKLLERQPNWGWGWTINDAIVWSYVLLDVVFLRTVCAVSLILSEIELAKVFGMSLSSVEGIAVSQLSASEGVKFCKRKYQAQASR